MELDIRAIQAILPHRAPFLMIDHVEMVDENRIVARKAVAVNEPYFQGHFPGHPIMPGVLIVEALAQAGAVLAASQSAFDSARHVMYFMTIDKAKFRKPVFPGDVLRLEGGVPGWHSTPGGPVGRRIGPGMISLVVCQGRGLVALALLAAAAGPACRKAPRLGRGDAAAVVVVQRSKELGPQPVSEREPNNAPTEAQELTWSGTPASVALNGRIEPNGAGKAIDVDVFKVVVPGQRLAASPDAEPAPDLRLSAKRLFVTVVPDPGFAPVLEVLDETLRVGKGLSGGPGETLALPNLAALPGTATFFRIKAAPAPAGKGRAGPDAGASAGTGYRLTVLLLDFEAADEREPNDRMETAGTLSWQGQSALAAGLFGWRHDEDWYRLPLDTVEPGQVLNLEIEGVGGVAAGLSVNDSAGKKIVSVRGRKGEKLTLRNLTLPSLPADAGAAAGKGRWWYLVVRTEAGVDLERRYVLHAEAAVPETQGGYEIEPNDEATLASPLADGTTTGYLPAGDVDFFRYVAKEPRDLDVEIQPPSRVKVKIEILSENGRKLLAEASAPKAQQPARILGFACPVEPILIRLSQGKRDGNASEPYSLRVASRLSQRDAGR
jgi:3-hydroxyacyl-[acyl-carrier-protein] dehydratase